MIPQAEYLEENIVILAIRNHMGNVGLAAKELGLSRGELVGYMARHPDTMEAKKQVKEFVKDQAEDLLVEGMQTDPNLLMFYLKTQARDRGYGSTPNSASIHNKVEVNVDARTLIEAMRRGIEQHENQIAGYLTSPVETIDAEST